jgi:hypothetical protein
MSTTQLIKYSCPKLTRSVGVARIPGIIAIACFVAMVGCSDSTGPKAQEEWAFSGLAVLADELRDAADVFAQGVEAKAVRDRAVFALNCLADQLLAERVASSRTALAQARSVLADLDDVSAIELAPVRLALDHIERRINQLILE